MRYYVLKCTLNHSSFLIPIVLDIYKFDLVITEYHSVMARTPALILEVLGSGLFGEILE